MQTLQEDNEALRKQLEQLKAKYNKLEESVNGEDEINLGFPWSIIGSAAISVAKVLIPIALGGLGTAEDAGDFENHSNSKRKPQPPKANPAITIGSLEVYKHNDKLYVRNVASKDGYGANLMFSRVERDQDESGSQDGQIKPGSQVVFNVHFKPDSTKAAELTSFFQTYKYGDIIARPYPGAAIQKKSRLGDDGPTGTLSWSTVGKTIALLAGVKFLITTGIYLERTTSGFSIVTTTDQTLISGSLRVLAQGISNAISGVLPQESSNRKGGKGKVFTTAMIFALPSSLNQETNIGLELDIEIPLDDMDDDCVAEQQGVRFVALNSKELQGLNLE